MQASRIIKSLQVWYMANRHMWAKMAPHFKQKSAYGLTAGEYPEKWMLTQSDNHSSWKFTTTETHNNHHCIALYFCKYVVFIFVIKITHSKTLIWRKSGKNPSTTAERWREWRRHSLQSCSINRRRKKWNEKRKCVVNNQISHALVYGWGEWNTCIRIAQKKDNMRTQVLNKQMFEEHINTHTHGRISCALTMYALSHIRHAKHSIIK